MKFRVLLAALVPLVASCATSDDYSETSDDLDELDLAGDPAVSPDRSDDPDPTPDTDAVGDHFAGVTRATVAVPAAPSIAKYSEASADADALAPSTTRTSRAIPITGVKQHWDDWCVPASGHTILSAFRDDPPTQSTLANRMHTWNGTPMVNVPPVLNDYQQRNHYILATVTDVDWLLYIVHYNVKTTRAPMMAALEGGDLPDWAAHGLWGYHAIVLYGWIKDGTDNWIKTWDPLHVRWSGAHAFRARVIQRAMNAQESYLVW